MKQFIAPAYTFTPGASGVGTVNLSGISGFNIKFLVAIINQTRGVTIYATGSSALRYTNVAGTTVTLFADTTGQSGSDVLQIIYEDQTILASESTLSLLNNKVPAKGLSNAIPSHSDEYIPVRPLPQVKFRTTFAKTIASGVDSEFFTLLQTGAGQAVSQSGGNLVITSGTTTNSETVLRSTRSFADSMTLRWASQLSQRIVNQQFFVELVDVIGDGLAVTVNSATSITVTIPSNPFNSENVGQSLYVGVISGIAGAVPGRYAIASVSGNNVNFTVAGWPASGSGTLSLFGWNYHQVIYSGATATSALYDAQRRGWASGSTTATINTTAAPGHIGTISSDDGVAAFLDQVAASSTALQLAMRASRVQNIPAQETQMFIQIRVLNGTTAPASTTTWTVGFVACENYAPQSVSLTGVKPQAFNSSTPVSVLNTITTNIAAAQTLATVTTVGTVTSGNLGINSSIADVASAAITTTATTAAFTPTFGTGYIIQIPVTATSGTGQFMDISVEESDDGGTGWFKVYDFPRITATGTYRSPILRSRGNRVRYVQTIGGTTPSFTRAINRLQTSGVNSQIAQLVDRTIVLNTLNSATPVLNVEGCQDFNLSIRVTAQTTAATVAIQFSDNGTDWHTSATTITTVVGLNHAKVQNEQWKFARAIVSAAGTGVTMDYLCLRGTGH